MAVDDNAGLKRIFLGIGLLGGSLVILGWQCTIYLQTGEWWDFSVLEAAYFVTASPWIVNPTSWIGLHAILAKTPFFLVPIAFAWLVMPNE